MSTATFDPYQFFESVAEAIDLIFAQDDPIATLKAVVCANIDHAEFGFTAELITAFELKLPHPKCSR